MLCSDSTDCFPVVQQRIRGLRSIPFNLWRQSEACPIFAREALHPAILHAEAGPVQEQLALVLSSMWVNAWAKAGFRQHLQGFFVCGHNLKLAWG